MKNIFYILILIIGTLLFLLSSLTSTTNIEALPVEYPIESRIDIVPTTYNEEALTVIPTDYLKIIKEIEEKPTSQPLNIKRSPYKELIERNGDYRGWINLPGTAISYPFVKGQDNDYYLKRSFDKTYDTKGTVFMDYRNLGFGFSQHILLYGHNMKDGSMFGDLKSYKDAAYALDNRFIEIEDLYGTRTFEIYASYYAEADSQFIQTTFTDDLEYQTFIQTQLENSDVSYDLFPSKNDNILTLVTCTYEVDNGRYFLHAVEVPSINQ